MKLGVLPTSEFVCMSRLLSYGNSSVNHEVYHSCINLKSNHTCRRNKICKKRNNSTATAPVIRVEQPLAVRQGQELLCGTRLYLTWGARYSTVTERPANQRPFNISADACKRYDRQRGRSGNEDISIVGRGVVMHQRITRCDCCRRAQL